MMKTWMVAGLLAVGVQAHGRITNDAADERRKTCLNNYASAERDLAALVLEFQISKKSGYTVMTASGGGYLYCIAKRWSVPGIVGCTMLFALPGGAGYAWNEEMDRQTQIARETALIMSIYSSIKDGRDGADEVIRYMQDLRIDMRHDQFAKQNVIQMMERGRFCDAHGVPNVTYKEFLSSTRPGDL